MTEKKVLIQGAGGPAGVGMTRCLRDHFEVYGEDSSQWGELMMEAMKDPSHVHVIVPIADSLVKKAVDYPAASNLLNFLPDWTQINLCQDKARAAEMLGTLGPKLYWQRDTHGAGGKGAVMLSEYLPGRNYSVELVYHEGKLLAKFQKERISYLVKSREPMVTASGASAVSICTDRADVFERAIMAIEKLELQTRERPHGFYGVDLREDENGVPRVNEINAGRLLTASYTYFWKTGYNLPLVGLSAHFGLPIPELPEYPVGYGIIRQADQEPKLFGPEITQNWRETDENSD